MHATPEVRKEALAFMHAQRTAVLATVDAAGNPSAATVTPLTDEAFATYFVTHKGSRKYENLIRTPNVAVVFGTDAEVPMTLQIEGIARELSFEDYEHLQKTLAQELIDREMSWWPLLKMYGVEFVVIKVDPTWARLLDVRHGADISTYTDGFHEVFPIIERAD